MTAGSPRRIGLFGGCFNPVHNGHLEAARRACAHLGLDEVRFIPTRDPPMRRNPALIEGHHRLAMLKRAIASEPCFSVSAVELERDGPSFTVDTVDFLQARAPDDAEWFFLLGADCLARLPGWKGFDRLREMVRFAILPRGQIAFDDTERAGLLGIPMPDFDLSSTQVRESIWGGESISHLVPAAVEEYIRSNHLYGAIG